MEEKQFVTDRDVQDRIKVMWKEDPEFPDVLRNIKQPPHKLYYIGDLDVLKQRCVAVVGSRTTTGYGRSMGQAIASRLADRNITVVSGMAAGIDTQAHRGALKVMGKTVAVLGCGLDICYPKENVKLKHEIEETGLLLSEYAPGTEPVWYNFPQRNRIISGLCEMTVVVQARNTSGALITAELAMEQGRTVMAVPGNIDSQYNLGNNKLIRDGVTPIITVDDVLEPLGLKHVDEKEASLKLSPTEMDIFRLLQQQGEMSRDQLAFAMGCHPDYVAPIVAVMEIKGFVYSDMGKIFLANG